MQTPLDSHAIIQIGFVVKDLAKASTAFKNLFGVECHPPRDAFPNVRYHGVPTQVKAHITGAALSDNLHIEIIQPGDSDSAWKDWLEEHGDGVAFLGVVVHDLEKAYETLSENNIQELQGGGASWGSYHLVDMNKALGVMFNIKCDKPYND